MPVFETGTEPQGPRMNGIPYCQRKEAEAYSISTQSFDALVTMDIEGGARKQVLGFMAALVIHTTTSKLCMLH